MKFGKHLRSIRESLGLTLRDAAKLIGISAPALCQIERGGKCDPDSQALVWIWLMTPEKKVA